MIHVKMPWGRLSNTICSLERTCHMHSVSTCIPARRQVTQPSGASEGGSHRSPGNSAGKPVPYLYLSNWSNLRGNKVCADGPRTSSFLPLTNGLYFTGVLNRIIGFLQLKIDHTVRLKQPNLFSERSQTESLITSCTEELLCPSSLMYQKKTL